MYKVGDTAEINGKKVIITYSDGRNFSYKPAPDDDVDTEDDEIVFERPKSRRKRK